MTLLIGVDEAGYGPNYGPLAVAATAWRVVDPRVVGGRRKAEGKSVGVGLAARREPQGRTTTQKSAVAERATSLAAPDLYKLLRRAVVRSPTQCARRLAIADSKALYKAGLGLRPLERGVLAALACLHSPGSFGELLAATGADPQRRRHELACHANDAQSLPLETPADEIAAAATRLQQVGEQSGVRLAAVRARLVFPAEFNSLVDHFGTKGAAVEATFRTRCEELLPTALASMTAKYHRELSMRAFNAYWAERVPGLRPTCGYPGDARRFKNDIAAAQRELGIDDRLLWRCR